MDNAIIILVLSFLLSTVWALILGVAGNRITKHYEVWQENRSLVNARESANKLRAELEQITSYHKNMNLFYYGFFKQSW